MKKYYRRMKNLIRSGKALECLKGRERFLLPSVDLVDFFPGCSKLNLHVPAGQVLVRPKDTMIVPPGGLLTLAVICQALKPTKIFEFGTYRGSSTLVMAMNTPPQTKIRTIDIAPDQRATHRHGMGVGGFADYTVGQYYQKTEWAGKIEQLYGDSRQFNFQPLNGIMDLVFVDADHTYAFVKSDSERAFELIRPGGVVLWDDYIWDADHPECAGVADYLHRILPEKKILHISGTRFAIYFDGGGAR